MAYVRGHYRNGHYVRGHVRERPAVRGGLGVVAILVLLVLVAYPTAQAGGDASGAAEPSAVRGYIVQLASFRNEATAHRSGAPLVSAGHDVEVLRSDDHPEMRGGWFVLVLGPFASKAEADAALEGLRGQFQTAYVRLLA